jgi:hypothetical protein
VRILKELFLFLWARQGKLLRLAAEIPGGSFTAKKVRYVKGALLTLAIVLGCSNNSLAQTQLTIWPGTTVPAIPDAGPDSPVELGVRHPPRSGWLGEWGRLKGGCPVGLGVALKRAFVDEFRSCRYYHPRPLVRGCSCELAPTRNPSWTLRIHGPRSARP